ncbi:hypothetical protein Tco_0201732 [Tanacetum coccineum]
MQMVGGNGRNQFRQYVGQNVGNLNRYNAVQNVRNQNANGTVVAAQAEGNGNGNGNNGNQVRCCNCRGIGHFARNNIVRPRKRDAAYLQTQLLIAQKEEAGIQLQAEEFDLMAAAGDLDEIEEVNANCILMANLQQASTSGTQTNKAPVYDSDGSAKSMKSCFGGMMVNFGFFNGLEMEAFGEAMAVDNDWAIAGEMLEFLDTFGIVGFSERYNRVDIVEDERLEWSKDFNKAMLIDVVEASVEVEGSLFHP